MITPAFADKFIKPFNGRDFLHKMDYDTTDIISAILKADKVSQNDTKLFAQNLQYSNLEDLCRQIFDFLLYSIKYKEDELGSQAVKKPSALWHYKYGDCKSFSLFTGSILKNLGIPYSYRFVSFSKSEIFTHVYVIAHGTGKNILIDAVYKRFNEQKPYKYKKDYFMKGLHTIGNAGGKTPTMLNFKKDIFELSDADMELEIIRQRAEIEKEIIAGIRGIGSAKVAEYERFITGIGQIQDAVLRGDTSYISGFIDGHPEGIGKIQLKKIFKKIVTPLKKAVKAVVKTVAKVVTLPIRLATKGALEITLPKAAPSFLYLFVNDPNLIKKMPDKVRKKRAAQAKFADFVVKAIGMKRNHFMGILRNGIMKRYKMSPEKKISQLMKIPESQVKGHAMGDIGIIDDIIKGVTELINLIGKLFGKKSPGNPAEMLPDESDFGTITNEQATELSKEVKQQPDAVEPGETMDAAQPGTVTQKTQKENDSLIPANGGKTGPRGISG